MLSPEVRKLCQQFASVLEYPTASLPETVDQCTRELQDFSAEAAESMKHFAAFVRIHKIEELEELYTQTFDATPATTMYFGYHLFGETPKRSDFMAKLEESYQLVGLSSGGELADHLCVMLRFLAVAKDAEFVAPLLAECLLPNLEKVEAGLRKDGNAYTPAIHSLRLLLERVSVRLGRMVKTGGVPHA